MSKVLELLGNRPVRHYQSGDRVLEQGAKSGVLLVLIEGAFEVRKGEFLIDVITDPGAVFGEISVLADVGHSADVTASVASSAYVVEDPRAFLRENPDFHLYVSELLARRLNYMVAYLTNVRQQYQGHDHIGMVDQVLESLVIRQPKPPGQKSAGIVRDSP
ncbi:Crp/Fnr family transcriptional regulator [Congregicoccus parvus]|uniref:Crp/Fnr family transcriptional regulator n=1 Tax=Congregicoccus parvus TaxID=3081749 RepID=UPI003FA5DE8C